MLLIEFNWGKLSIWLGYTQSYRSIRIHLVPIKYHLVGDPLELPQAVMKWNEGNWGKLYCTADRSASVCIVDIFYHYTLYKIKCPPHASMAMTPATVVYCIHVVSKYALKFKFTCCLMLLKAWKVCLHNIAYKQIKENFGNSQISCFFYANHVSKSNRNRGPHIVIRIESWPNRIAAPLHFIDIETGKTK